MRRIDAVGISGAFLVGVTGLFLGGYGLEVASVVLFSLGHLIGGTAAFLAHGKRLITATGLYLLVSGVYVGGGGLYSLVLSRESINYFTLLCLATTYFANLSLYAVLLRRSPAGRGTRVARLLSTSSVRRRLCAVSTGLVLTGVVMWLRGFDNPIAASSAFAGVAGLGLWCVLAWPEVGWPFRISSLAWAGLCFACYVNLFFSGGGRLVLISLALGYAICAAGVGGASKVKLLTILAIVPALALSGMSRVRRAEPELSVRSALSAVQVGAGLASAFGGLGTFAQLVEADMGGARDDAFPRQHGLTFVEAIVAGVPRAIWREKPNGFGFRLTEVLMPSYTHTGHTLAALSYGEWYVNFGWLGLVLMIPVVGGALWWLDRLQMRLFTTELATVRQALRVLILVLLVAGVADYVWVGLFTYVAREVFRAVCVAVVWATLALVASVGAHRRGGMGSPTVSQRVVPSRP